MDKTLEDITKAIESMKKDPDLDKASNKEVIDAILMLITIIGGKNEKR